MTGAEGRARQGCSSRYTRREAAGFENVSVEFTHQVADGMHGTIVKATKTRTPLREGLPVVQPAADAGCC